MTDTEPTSAASTRAEQDALEPSLASYSFKLLLAPLTLAICWAVAVFVVQECTTGANYPLPVLKAVGSRVVRFSLNLLACVTITFVIRGWVVYISLLGWATATSVLLIYNDYYGRALSWTTFSNHFAEGWAMGP